MKQFTNLFPAHKTIKFKLFPLGRTSEEIESLLRCDKERAMAYQVVKCLINDYCQNEIIAPQLQKVSCDNTWIVKLREFQEAANWEAQKIIQQDLIGIINKKLPKKFNSKALIEAIPDYLQGKSKEDLQRMLSGIHDYEIKVKNQNLQVAWNNGLEDFCNLCYQQFRGFSGYLDALSENLKFLFSGRKNGIAYRIVYQNLVTFERNRRAYESLILINETFRVQDEALLLNYSSSLTQEGINTYNERIGQLVKNLKEFGDTDRSFRNWHRRFKKLNKQILSPRVAPPWLARAYRSDEEMVMSLQSFLDEFNPLKPRLKQLIANLESYDEHIYYFRKSLSLLSVTLRNDYKALDEELSIPQEQANCRSLSLSWIPFRQELINEIERIIDSSYTDIEKCLASASEYLNTERAKRNDYRLDNTVSFTIKKLMDVFLSLYRAVKPLTGTGEEEDRNEDFYDEFTTIWDVLQYVQKLYNAVFAWLNKKPYENNSYPAYLDEFTLLKNWKEKAAYIKRNGKFYFIMFNGIDEQDIIEHRGDSAILYHVESQSPDRIKANLTKQFVFSKKANAGKGRPNPSKAKFVRDNPEFQADWERVKTEAYKVAGNTEALAHAIRYFQRCLQSHPDYNRFPFNFRPANDYTSLDDFVDSIKDKLFMMEETAINWSYVRQLAEEGTIYLFKLYNKDYAKNRVGGSKPNLHTLYWEAMFSSENLRENNIKLEEPKLFYREVATNRDGELNMRLIPHRYATDQLELHVPIHLNVNATASSDINMMVLDAIREGSIENVIGIDRGERNLLYYSVLRLSDGEIVDQKSLNITFNDVDYHAKLSTKEEEIHDEQREWKAKTSIRKLKEGYLSQAIHQLTSLIVKYHAVVVLEDLSEDFYSKRQKINKQIYQIFEKRLIEKLSYFVDKDAAEGQAGNIYSALQLSSPNLVRKDNKKIFQNGIVFFVPPEYTSAIDPVTGFCNLFDKNRVRNICELLYRFENICYNRKNDRFEFTWDYRNVMTYTRLEQDNISHLWTACSLGNRIEWSGSERNKNRRCEIVNLTQSMKVLFEKHGIQYQTGKDVREAVCSIRNNDFKKELKRLFFLMLSLRNSIVDGKVKKDYILSPVQNQRGSFFDSREYEELDNPKLPKCGDANGAYNIARKGILTIRKLENGNEKALTLDEWVISTQKGNIRM